MRVMGEAAYLKNLPSNTPLFATPFTATLLSVEQRIKYLWKLIIVQDKSRLTEISFNWFSGWD